MVYGPRNMASKKAGGGEAPAQEVSDRPLIVSGEGLFDGELPPAPARTSPKAIGGTPDVPGFLH